MLVGWGEYIGRMVCFAMALAPRIRCRQEDGGDRVAREKEVFRRGRRQRVARPGSADVQSRAAADVLHR